MILQFKYSAAQTDLASDPLYELKFVDEFDSLALNTNKWEVRWPWGPNLYNDSINTDVCGSNPMDIAYNYYPPHHNINLNRGYDTVNSGYHRLISKRENVTGQVFYWDAFNNFSTKPKRFKYTTAMLMSKSKFKYGYIEIRFRNSVSVPNNNPNNDNSYGPNLWMWHSDDADSAHYSEIDIFEMDGTKWGMAPCSHYRKRKQSSPTSYPNDTAFYHGNSYIPNLYAPYQRSLTVNINPNTWHTVGCEWTPEYTDFYYYTISNDTIQRFAINKYPVNRLTAMPLIIDIYAPAFQYCRPVDTVNTVFPFNYDIDYIKVYQMRQNCTSASFLNTSSATYQSTLYQDLTIGGSGGSAVFNNGVCHLAGQDFILLNEGFEVSGSGTVIISTHQCQTGQIMSSMSTSTIQPFSTTEITKAKKDD